MAVGTVVIALPVVTETPPDFPASALYDFRVASVGGQLVLWTALGPTSGALVDRPNRVSHPFSLIGVP